MLFQASLLSLGALFGASSVFVVPATARAVAKPAANVTWTPPPSAGRADYQLGGPYAPDSSVVILTRDRTATPLKGKYNVCYINAFQTQPEDGAWWKSNHPDLLLKNSDGDYFEDDGWPGEYMLDTRTAAKRSAIAAIMNPWIAKCASDGFQAIEPDNLDTFTRTDGLISQANNVAMAKLFTQYAHSKGLAVAQKNTGGELGTAGRDQIMFDFAVAEECQKYTECDSYTNVYGKHVIEIEYDSNSFNKACSVRKGQASIILRDRNVVPKGQSGYVYQWC